MVTAKPKFMPQLSISPATTPGKSTQFQSTQSHLQLPSHSRGNHFQSTGTSIHRWSPRCESTPSVHEFSVGQAVDIELPTTMRGTQWVQTLEYLQNQ